LESTLSALFASAAQGDAIANERLFQALYAELHRLAQRELWRSGGGVTLGATTLVHEAFLDLSGRAAVPFPDHHRYRRFEARELIERAGREGLVPVTTEKDLARLYGQDDLAALAAITRALPVTLWVAEDAAFREWVLT